VRTIGERIRLLRGDEARDTFAPKCGVSRNTLANYETGKSDPVSSFLHTILAICPSTEPKWLLTGEGPMERGANTPPANGKVDRSLLQDVIAAVEEFLDDRDLELVPDRKAELITVLYDMFVEKYEKKVDKAVVLSLVKLAA
jgi:transcriptional regulator with XRE-family HTH domain